MCATARSVIVALLPVLLLAAWSSNGWAQSGTPANSSLEDLARAVVGLSIEIPPEARTAARLGTHREGNGVVIDDKGRIITIGYLILEASEVTVIRYDGSEFPARVLGYDAESGFGLLQAEADLGVAPVLLGSASGLKVRDPVLMLTRQGLDSATTASVVSRRTFAGYWEYLLEDAIYTVPAQGDYAGAALIDQDLRLVGIGSLYVENAAAEDFKLPGNLFVPIDRLKPILTDLMETGRPRTKPRPWLGVNVAEQFGRVIVTRVHSYGPAREAGLQPGDIILGVGNQSIESVEQFYRGLWALGEAGVVAPLRLLQRSTLVRIEVTTHDRYVHYRQPSSN